MTFSVYKGWHDGKNGASLEILKLVLVQALRVGCVGICPTKYTKVGFYVKKKLEVRSLNSFSTSVVPQPPVVFNSWKGQVLSGSLLGCLTFSVFSWYRENSPLFTMCLFDHPN